MGDPSVLRTAPLWLTPTVGSGGAISNSRASSGAPDALPLFALSAIGQPTAPAFDALQNPDAARPYAPGWKRTVDDAETVFLRTGPDADAQGTIYGDGLNTLDTNLFNGLDNPRWIISGGGTDEYNSTGKTKNQTVEENVVTALKNIFKMVEPGTGPGSQYDGTNGYVHLTLADVTEVANGAFEYGQQLRSLSLPKAQSIGDYAFQYGRALTTASLPEVQSIGNSAFYGCALTTVNLPKVQNIGKEAFLGCALTTVSLPAAQNIGSQAFRSCKALTTLSLPEAQSIGSSAFTDCSALTTLSLPEAQSIGSSAFIYCTVLTNINLPEARSIESYAFSNCYALTSISLPKAQSIGNSTFTGCKALTTLSLPAVQSIGINAFDACPVLTRLDLSGVTDESQVHSFAFNGIGYDQAYYGGTDRTNQCTLILNPALRPACTDAEGGTTGPLVRFHNCRWKEIQFLE
ncbi:leucine-rich repeat domain-containing protein [Bacteroides sp. GD17]|uniref:leucine-rich repeat domain-containing protein n=1 Tax=Bacteroides sp. GD17 TaxID=3139826 RepID=UPI00313DAC05